MIYIELNDPQCLVTATLKHVKITNLNQCINLQNLYSGYNEF